MEQKFIHIINYIYILSALSFVLEFTVSREKGEALALKLIDWSKFLSTREVDKLISRVSLYLSQKYDLIYGKKYFGIREWIASAVIAFTYCYIFYLTEVHIGFKTTLLIQLGFWFVPNLVADIISINFTRWLLKKIYTNPGRYIQYLFYDILIFIISFYICFSFTMIYLGVFSDHSISRIILHPFYLFSTAINDYPDPMAIDALLLIAMASTALIPTLLHVVFIVTSIALKFITPILRVFVNNLIEKMISFERHPVGTAVIVTGLFCLPFFIAYKFIFQ